MTTEKDTPSVKFTPRYAPGQWQSLCDGRTQASLMYFRAHMLDVMQKGLQHLPSDQYKAKMELVEDELLKLTPSHMDTIAIDFFHNLGKLVGLDFQFVYTKQD